MGNSNRVLVTGGAGFIGGHLVRRLVADGVEVHVVVQPGLEAVPAKSVAHVHDGSMAGMNDIVGSVRPDTVFHLASVFLAAHAPEDVGPLITSNVLFGTQLLEAMALHGCRRLVNTGTGWQNFGGPEYDPVNLYAATKQAFEDVARYYVNRGVTTTTLALYDTYGPNDPRPKILPTLIRAAFRGESLDLSPGEQLLHIVYIDDIIAAFVAAASRLEGSVEPACERFSIAAEPPLTLRGLAAAVETVTGRRIDARWGARPYRPREIMAPWIGSRLPGWRPNVSIHEGIARVIEAGPFV